MPTRDRARGRRLRYVALVWSGGTGSVPEAWGLNAGSRRWPGLFPHLMGVSPSHIRAVGWPLGKEEAGLSSTWAVCLLLPGLDLVANRAALSSPWARAASLRTGVGAVLWGL